MLELSHIKARVVRLRELTVNLAKEVDAQRRAEGPLSPQERRQYLDGLQSGLAGLDDARVVLAGAVKRLEAAAAERNALTGSDASPPPNATP
jgi:hypothetical protein